MDPHRPFRKVYLPLEKLGRCHACSKTPNSGALKLCAACGEDWPTHKAICGTVSAASIISIDNLCAGKTDRIELETYYPFLAYMAEAAHLSPSKPLHPAVSHAIVNSPNPGSAPAEFPDGSAAKLVMLGDPLDLTEIGSAKWWPTAMTDKVRGKFFRRIAREGYSLPIAISICLALLAEMYNTTAVDSTNGQPERRTRLTYKSSPIADFGVVAGSVDVKSQDKLAYFSLSDMSFVRGQDPDDHYWIYFTTIRGENILLDCAMFHIQHPYLCNDLPPLDSAPAFFRERAIDRHAPDLHTERTRMSVLRNADLHLAVAYPLEPIDMKLVCGFMETLAGRAMSPVELEFTYKSYNLHYCAIAINVDMRAWVDWPASPGLGIEVDPGEVVDDRARDNSWFEHMKKWKSKHKKSAADKDALVVAFKQFQARHAEIKRKGLTQY
ncbi:hypothetical protein DFH09DRAFT_1144050 [Mycena vulgaris]|nr:hypothetical protein DFH09DRAFT_1144050 [Mycena vulgaris]